MLSSKYGFRATPVLDQYFIADEGLVQRAVGYAKLTKDDIVLEIGPGLGFLTTELARKAGRIIAIEKDKRLETLLKDELAPYPNVDTIFADAVDSEWPKFNKFVSNIPFSASAPIIFKLLEHDFERAVLFVQREFAEKMMDGPGGPEYGRLSVMTQTYFKARIMEVVNKVSFYPIPKIDATIIVLEKTDIPRDRDFDVFVRELFRYKNKDVHNAVKIAFNKELADDRKVFYLSVKEVKELYEKVKAIQ